MPIRAIALRARLFLFSAAAIGTAFTGLSACTQSAWAQAIDMATLAAQVVETNPQIESQREAVRGLKARLRSARSGFLPTVEANGLVQHRRLNIHGGAQPDAAFTAAEGTVEARFRLYDGWRTPNSVQVAQQELESGEAVLDGTISDVLLDLLTSAADIRRDRQIRQFAEMQNKAIGEQLEGTSKRLRFGEATKTDENQAKARLASSRAGILSAEQELTVSATSFEAVSGQSASTVPPLPQLAPLPLTLEAAIAQAMQRNQELQAAQRNAAAAKEGVDFAKGALAPQADLVAGYEYLAGGVANLYTGKLPNDRSATYAGVAVRVPIFQGGREYAEISRAEALQGQRLAQVSMTERAVVEDVTAAWARWTTAVRTIDAARDAVQANEQAAAGVAQEALGGSRTTLDVLDAQNELLNARVALERAQRNEFVARANVLAVTGLLNLAAIQPVSAPAQ